MSKDTAPDSETPVERCSRLAFELSEALDEYSNAEFMAVVLPRSRGRNYPVMFGVISAHQRLVQQQIENVKPKRESE